MDHAFVHILQEYGYFGLFGLLVLGIVGLPLPDETLLAFVGVMIKQGHMHFWGSLVAAYLGSAIGITLSYLVGRFVGKGVVARFGRFLHLTEERLLRVEKYMERFGGLTLFIGYFVPGLRHLTALSAGFGQMKFRIFAPFAYAGALVWALTFLMLGQFLSHEMHHLHHALYVFRYWIAVIVIVSLVAPLMWRMLRRRRAN